MSKRSKIDRKLARAAVEWYNGGLSNMNADTTLEKAVEDWSESMRQLNVEIIHDVNEFWNYSRRSY